MPFPMPAVAAVRDWFPGSYYSDRQRYTSRWRRWYCCDSPRRPALDSPQTAIRESSSAWRWKRLAPRPIAKPQRRRNGQPIQPGHFFHQASKSVVIGMTMCGDMIVHSQCILRSRLGGTTHLYYPCPSVPHPRQIGISLQQLAQIRRRIRRAARAFAVDRHNPPPPRRK